jgi:hypothetical protein
MPPRQLRATPSHTADLTTFQKILLKEATSLEESLLDKRIPLWSVAAAFQDERVNNVDKTLGEVALVMQRLKGLDANEAERAAKSLLAGNDGKLSGLRHTCVVQFRFDDESFWRGPPDNLRLSRFIKSIVCTRFRADASIASRTLELTGDVATFQLLFGDGSARGVAALIVWKLVFEHIAHLDPSDDADTSLVDSLLKISTMFEQHGDGSSRSHLIAQAARQNQSAAVLPVSTVQWLLLVKAYGKTDFSSVGRSALVKMLEEMVGGYNSHPDVEAYSVEPPTKKLKGRRKSGVAVDNDEGNDRGLKIGTRRLVAMRNFLQGGSSEGLQLIVNHLMWVSDYRHSAFSDQIFAQKWFYIGSVLPKCVDSDATVSDPVILPANISSTPLMYDTPLTSSQFERLIAKGIAIFEGSTNHLDREELKVKFKPTEEALGSQRCAIGSVVEVCQQTVSNAAFSYNVRHDYRSRLRTGRLREDSDKTHHFDKDVKV